MIKSTTKPPIYTQQDAQAPEAEATGNNMPVIEKENNIEDIRTTQQHVNQFKQLATEKKHTQTNHTVFRPKLTATTTTNCTD